MACDLKIVPPQNRFLAYSLQTNAQALADYLPGGELYRAKNIQNSNIRKYLQGVSYELIRVENTLKQLADDYYIWTTSELLTEWENTLGIPDSCFKTEGKTLDERRRQCIAKLALCNVQTREDFIFLACFLGFDVSITNGVAYAVFPLIFPILLSSEKEAHFTMVVTFNDRDRPSDVFPLTFPIVFGEDDTQIIKCLFTKLKPAETRIIFRYRND